MKINICVFNNIHPVHNTHSGVTDQVEQLSFFFEQNSIEYKISYLLDPNAINIVIENFTENSIEVIQSFCNKWNKKILIVMTEHISLDNGIVKFGPYSLSNTDYIGNMSQRFYSLSLLFEHTIGFSTIGELPFLYDLKKMFFVEKVYRFDYPVINHKMVSTPSTTKKYDMSFSGFLTNYRSKIISELKSRYKFKYHDITRSDRQRKDNAMSARVAVNIPQEEDWPWVSPMRVIYYLSIGIPCVHIGKGDKTLFYDKVLSWVDVDQAIKSPDLVHKKQLDAYKNLSIDDGSLKSLLEVWSSLENL